MFHMRLIKQQKKLNVATEQPIYQWKSFIYIKTDIVIISWLASTT